MTNHQSLGHIGEAMAGTNQQTKEKEMTVTVEEVQNYHNILLGETGKEVQLQAQRKRLTDAIYAQIDSDTAPDDDHIAEVTAAMNKDVQLRDFVLGLPSERPIKSVNTYLAYFMDTVPNEFIAPIASVLAANLYSLEESDSAKEVLSKALEAYPRYSLAQLLNRVFNSGWPAGVFTAMTHELHPKVKEGMGI
jgi:hypothetical protein